MRDLYSTRIHNTTRTLLVMKRHDLYKRCRSCSVTCLSFGKDRKEEYPDFFFCHGCDGLEDAVLNSMRNKSKASCKMKKYMCTGGHTPLSHPTTLKQQYQPNIWKNDKNPQENPDLLGAAVADGKNSAIQSAGKESPSKNPNKKKRCKYRQHCI